MRSFGCLGLCVLLLAACAKHGEPEPEREPETETEPDLDAIVLPASGPAKPVDTRVLPPLKAHVCDPLTDGAPRLRVGPNGEPVADPRPVRALAELSDGRWLLVTDPAPGEREGRVFFGPRAAVLERGLWEDSRPKGPGPIGVRFVVGDAFADARFPKECPDVPGGELPSDGNSDCPGTLYIEDDVIALERRAPDALAGITFRCDTQSIRVGVEEAWRRAGAWTGGGPGACSRDRDADADIGVHEFVCTDAHSERVRVHVDARTGEVSFAEDP